jgi:dienelactone hydrolase
MEIMSVNSKLNILSLLAAFGLMTATLIVTAQETAQEPVTVAPGPAKETLTRTIEDGGTGPYKAIVVSDSSLATHAIYRPQDLSRFGEMKKLPIVVWGNGGCANSSQEHQNFLSEIASRGYLVVAIGPLQEAGQGRRGGGGMGGGRTTGSQLTEAMDWAIAQSKNKDSIYFGKVDTTKIAAAGMSCGGLQALEISPDPRVSTTIVCNSGIIGGGGDGARRGPPVAEVGPTLAEGDAKSGTAPAAGEAPRGDGAIAAGRGARGGRRGGGGMPGMPALGKDLLAKLHAPVLYLLGGSSDIAYENGMDDYRRIEKLPAFVANMDVGHGGTYGRPHGGEFATVAAAWLDWQLKGDKEAAKMFTGDYTLSKSTTWKVEKKNIP